MIENKFFLKSFNDSILSFSFNLSQKKKQTVLAINGFSYFVVYKRSYKEPDAFVEDRLKVAKLLIRTTSS